MSGSLDDLDFQIADELQDVHLAIDLSLEKFDVSGIGGELIQCGIDGYPLADPDFGPGVIVKGVAQIDHADHGLCGNPRRSGYGVEENGVLITVALPNLENFQCVGNADRGLFGDFRVDPIFDFYHRFADILSPPNNLRGELANLWVVALQEHRRLDEGVKQLLPNWPFDEAQAGDFFTPDLQLILTQTLAADVHEWKVLEVDTAQF